MSLSVTLSFSVEGRPYTSEHTALAMKLKPYRSPCSPCPKWPLVLCSNVSPHTESSWSWCLQSWPVRNPKSSVYSQISPQYYLVLNPAKDSEKHITTLHKAMYNCDLDWYFWWPFKYSCTLLTQLLSEVLANTKQNLGTVSPATPSEDTLTCYTLGHYLDSRSLLVLPKLHLAAQETRRSIKVLFWGFLFIFVCLFWGCFVCLFFNVVDLIETFQLHVWTYLNVSCIITHPLLDACLEA